MFALWDQAGWARKCIGDMKNTNITFFINLEVGQSVRIDGKIIQKQIMSRMKGREVDSGGS
jgi:RNase P/RNase MRP subunit p29